MPTITREVQIAADVATVWRLLEDVRRLPEYSPSTAEVLDAPPRLTQVGQTYVQVGTLLGRKLRSTWTVTAIEPPHLLRSEGALFAGVRYCLTQELAPASHDGSVLRIRIDYTVPGGPLGRLAAKAGAEGRAGREAQTVLDGIRTVAEAQRPG